MRDTFVFHTSWHKVLKGCPAEVRLEVYDAIIEYAQSGTLSELKPMAQMAFSFIKNDLDADMERYEAICEARRNAGQKGANGSKRGQMVAKGSKREQKPYDNDSDSDYDNGSDTLHDNGKENPSNDGKEKFTPPTIVELEAYCKSIRSCIDVEDFINYYEATGWKVQGKPMKNWKLTVQTWTKKDRKERPWLYEEPKQETDEQWES